MQTKQALIVLTMSFFLMDYVIHHYAERMLCTFSIELVGEEALNERICLSLLSIQSMLDLVYMLLFP